MIILVRMEGMKFFLYLLHFAKPEEFQLFCSFIAPTDSEGTNTPLWSAW